jgi:membrane-associated phospholipid phosphatase
VETLDSVPSTASFPSGHVAGALVLYGLLTLIARARMRHEWVPRVSWALPFAVAVIVALARVYEGVHHPTDVLAGFLLGLGALLGAGWATGLLGRRDPGRARSASNHR